MQRGPAYCRTVLTVQRPHSFSITSLHPRRYLASQHSPPQETSTDPPPQESRVDAVSHALRDASPENNSLLSPVHIPEDPHAIIKERHPATSILANSAIVVQRELEMMNLMLGFEQANKYVILSPNGDHLGFMAEQEFGMGNAMGRQFFRTHRAFTTHIFDRSMKEVLRFHRPFSYFNSRIRVYDPLEPSSSTLSSSTSLQSTAGALSNQVGPVPQTSSLALSDMRVIGEAQQQWAPLRRKYNMFLFRDTDWQDPAIKQFSPQADASSSKALQVVGQDPGQYHQFAYVDEPFLSWDFSLMSSSSQLLGSVNRNFAGFGREIFTDTGVYALRMDAAGLSEEPSHLISRTGETEVAQNAAMTLDQRAVMLATAVSIDFDYFSRKRGGVFGGMFPWYAAGGAAEGGAVGAETTEVIAGTAGIDARGAGVEGAAAGAGSIAGYEAMQRGFGRGEADDVSPTSGQDPYMLQEQDYQQPTQQGSQEETWGTEEYPWRKPPSSGDGSSGGSGSEGGGWSIWDFFDGE